MPQLRIMSLCMGLALIIIQDSTYIWIYVGIPLALIGFHFIAEILSNGIFLLVTEITDLELRG